MLQRREEHRRPIARLREHLPDGTAALHWSQALSEDLEHGDKGKGSLRHRALFPRSKACSEDPATRIIFRNEFDPNSGFQLD